jgi:hypothetical protein
MGNTGLIVVGLMEVLTGVTLIVLIWKFSLVDKYFEIGDNQESFLRKHSERIDKWLENRGESESQGYLREHRKMLQWIWTIPSLAIIIWGALAIFELREYMRWEILIPICIIIGLLPFLLGRKSAKDGVKGKEE